MMAEEEEDDLFEDLEFPAASAGLGSVGEVVWLRGSELRRRSSYNGGYGEEEDAQLFEKEIEPNDIAQGALGDCWLLAAVAGAAEFPEFVRQLFGEEKATKNGRYEVKLWSPVSKRMEGVTIDDRIPCSPDGTPLFAKPHGNELWVLLLERAFAKVAGGYRKLDGGYPVLAWTVMTGCEDCSVWQRGDGWFELRTDSMDSFDFSSLKARNHGRRFNKEDFFEIVRQYDAACFLASASISGDTVEKARCDGLIERHAYTVLRAEVFQGTQLIQLRNPWGDSHEWNGPWSDSSHHWSNQEARDQLGYEPSDDGTFWMPFHDFTNTFDMLQVCKFSMARFAKSTTSSATTAISTRKHNKVPNIFLPWTWSSPGQQQQHDEEEILPVDHSAPTLQDLANRLHLAEAQRDAALAKVALLESRLEKKSGGPHLSPPPPPPPPQLLTSTSPPPPTDDFDLVLHRARKVYAAVMTS